MADLYDKIEAIMREMQEEAAQRIAAEPTTVHFPPGVAEELGGTDEAVALAKRLLGWTPYYAEVDFSCGGVETAEPTIAHYLETMGFAYETTHRIAYSITRETNEPDLMAAVRDIARGS